MSMIPQTIQRKNLPNPLIYMSWWIERDLLLVNSATRLAAHDKHNWQCPAVCLDRHHCVHADGMSLRLSNPRSTALLSLGA